MAEGRIIKALSGFYYVKSGDTVYACKGRGVFRKRKINPLVGDFVVFQVTDDAEGYITEIKPRDNALKRPPISNINQAVIVSSARMPDFSTHLLDRFLVLVESKHINPIIFITKMDLLQDEEQAELQQYIKDYADVGYDIESFSSSGGSDLTHLKQHFNDKVTVVAGQSGVGKSSILNNLNASLFIETDEISTSLGRGKHTTRYVELVEIGNGLVADTPGFSSLDFSDIELEDLAGCFPEMRVRQADCRFRGCMHIKEPHCAVKTAVEQEVIQPYRYKNYTNFYNEIKSRKPRYS